MFKIKCERDPGPGRASDDQIIDFVRNKGFTVYHPVGTCKMGSDPAAVVDQKLRVHWVPRAGETSFALPGFL